MTTDGTSKEELERLRKERYGLLLLVLNQMRIELGDDATLPLPTQRDLKRLEEIDQLISTLNPATPKVDQIITGNLIKEVDDKIGSEWFSIGFERIANWEYISALELLFTKRVEIWMERGKPHVAALQATSNEFNDLSFGVALRQCECCGVTFNPTNDLHLARHIRSFVSRMHCTEKCKDTVRWHTWLKKHMDPNAEFDHSITWEAVWERYGPNCYICGIETIYNQDDLDLRQGTKAWKARWGTFKRGDVNRQAVVEHIQPRSRGGSHTWDNVRISCSKCNLLKGDR